MAGNSGATSRTSGGLTDQLTFNYVLRFDQVFQYVDANQFSPRASFTYKPWWSTVFHIGYMRTFTPPPQVLGRAIDSTLFDNTTLSAAIDPVTNLPIRSDPIQPERAHVVDAGVVQQLLPQCPVATSGPTKAPVAAPNCPSLEVGANVYYKAAKDLLDDGQFGQALALTAFNYEKGENYGAEATLRFRNGNFSFDTSWAYGLQHATHIVSNQALFSAEDSAFIQNNWIHTDHDQYISGSARAAYRWTDTHT